MKEDFVTYELAVKLKEKGYNCELPYAMYNEIGQFFLLTTSAPYNVCESGYKCRVYYDYNDFDKNDFIAPTIPQVLKWLREEKKLYIEIWWLTQYTIKNLKGFQFVVTPICENPQRETDLELYCDYETAAIKGIEYVIDNLI